MLSSPRRIMSQNNLISCFGPKPTCHSYRLIKTLILFSWCEYAGVVWKVFQGLMKAGYLSCSLLRLVGADCQQQLFLNCIDTYLVLTPHANIVFLQIWIWGLILWAFKSCRYFFVHQKRQMEGQSLGDTPEQRDTSESGVACETGDTKRCCSTRHFQA